MEIENHIRVFVKSLSFWVAIVASTVASSLLVLLLGSGKATKIVGADNTNVRTLYYHIVSNIDGKKASSDNIVLYNPLNNVSKKDRIQQLAEELTLVSSYNPQVIVFDYILTDTASYAPNSKQALVDAIQNCVDAGIVFIATEVKDNQKGSEFPPEKSYFQEPPYSLAVESGNTLTSFHKLDHVLSDGNLPWVPIVVSKHVLSRPVRPDSYYQRRYINFSPGRIKTAHSAHQEGDLVKMISSKIVIFSDFTRGDDMHELLTFPIKGIVNDGSDIRIRASGAELLWYSIRDELENKWDVEVPFLWVFLFTIIYTGIFFVWSYRIFSSGKRKGTNKLLTALYLFLLFISFDIFALGIWGAILMCFHWVFPLAIPAISLVFINLCNPIFE